jgi:hypothetical protein
MIQRPVGDITEFNKEQLPVLTEALDSLFSGAAGIKYTDILPTVKTVSDREIVVYDDGAGTKRLYFVTAKGNLGYATLT